MKKATLIIFIIAICLLASAIWLWRNDRPNMASPETETISDVKGFRAGCEKNGGSWLAEYRECENADKDWCEGFKGDFSECASACRHQASPDGGPTFCITQCVPVCRFLEGQFKESSRQPTDESCRWEGLFGHGLRFLSQVCREDHSFRRMVAVEGGFAEERLAGIGRTDIEVLEKAADKPAEEVIKEKFIDVLGGEAKEKCQVGEISDSAALSENIIRYAIRPTGDYLVKSEQRFIKEPAYRPCGDYGITGGAVPYFEVHKNYPEKFLFVRVGRDAPLFDEASFEFMEE